MKIFFTLYSLFSIISMSVCAQTNTTYKQSIISKIVNSNNAQQIVTSTQYKPAKELVWNWDASNAVWNFSDSIRNTYNSTGNITQRLLYASISSFNNEINTYTYNINNKILIDSNFKWNGSSFIPNRVSTYTYDVNGNKTSETEYSFWNGSVWTSGSKIDFTYDVNNNLIQELSKSWNGISWANNSKTDYTLSGSFVIEAIYQAWNGSTWYNSSKQDFSYTSGQLSSVINYSLNGSIWNAISKLNNIVFYQWYGLFNEKSKISGYTQQVPNGILWKDTIRTTITFDSFGNQTNFLIESKPSTTYITDIEIKNNYQYNVNNSMIEDIEQIWYTTPNFVNNKKREFFDFFQFTTCIPSQPTAIIGNTNINSGAIETYSIIADTSATSYIWSLPAGYSGSSTSNSISVTVGSTSGVISVVAQNSCGLSSPRSLNVTIGSVVNPPITNYDWEWAKVTDDKGLLEDMATDKLGNTYIIGVFGASTITFGSITLNKISTGTNLFIAKYDPNGNALWAKAANIAQTGSSEFNAITDNNNNVYISGKYQNSIMFDGVTLSNPTGNSGSAMFFVKYSSTGSLIWAQDVNYTSDITVTGMSVDSQNNVFIAGDYSAADVNFGGTLLISYSNNNPFIVKYDSLGFIVWAKGASQNTLFGYANFCYDVATDLNGNSYITGGYISNTSNLLTFGTITLPTTNGGRNFYLTKYNSLGDVDWVKTSSGNSPNNGGREDIGRSIATDLNGDIVVTGMFESASIDFGGVNLTNTTTNNFEDVFVVKYNSLGSVLWAKKAGGANNEQGTGIAVDVSNSIFVSGYFNSKPVVFGPITINQIGMSPLNFIAKYDDLGNEVFVKHIEQTTSSSIEYPVCVTSDINGNVFLSGLAYNNAVFGSTTLTSGGIYVAKLSQSPLGINEVATDKGLFNIYPNPSSGIFQIETDEQLKNASIKIYNTQGQTIFQSNQFVSEINISNQAKGIYFLQLLSEGKVSTQKIFLQ